MSKKPPSLTEGKSPDELLERAYHVGDANDALNLYRDWADTYDGHLVDDLGYVLPGRVAAVVAEHITDKSTRVIDIGCGTGLTGQALVAQGFSTIDGLDFSPDMLVQAGAKNIYGALVEADLTQKLDIASNTYAAAMSSGTFTEGHVGAEAFDEIFRILKPEGTFIASVNLEIWDEGGFGPKLESLTKAGTIAVEDVVKTIAFQGGGDHFHILVVKKCR
ncbi:MAG: class I SAM-dependent DNA methyltransferase [Hyphomicrobiales bacterium]